MEHTGQYKLVIKGNYIDQINDIIKEYGYLEVVQDRVVKFDEMENIKKTEKENELLYVGYFDGRTLITGLNTNSMPMTFEDEEITKLITRIFNTDIVYHAKFGESWEFQGLYSIGETIYKSEKGKMEETEEEDIGEFPLQVEDIFTMDVYAFLENAQKVVVKEFY